MFFESASEEREHAMKIISYLLMRGELTSEVRKLIQNPVWNLVHTYKIGHRIVVEKVEWECMLKYFPDTVSVIFCTLFTETEILQI
jgi:hypothetical protein